MDYRQFCAHVQEHYQPAHPELYTLDDAIVVPELVQGEFTSGNVVAELEKIISDGEPRSRMLQQLAGIRSRLKGEAGMDAPAKAAEMILQRIGSQ